MTNNSMAISLSQNSFSDSTSSWDYCTGSSSQQPHHPPSPTATNQSQENLLLTTPLAKKPRGRPPGSKNKPIEPSVRLVIINVDPGGDVMESIFDVARRRRVSLSVLNASGAITEVTLRNSLDDTVALKLHGHFTLLSLSGSYLYNNHYKLHLGATPPPPLSFGVHLSTSQGQVFGGTISGRVIAGDNVSLTLSTFKNPEIYKYVPEGKESDNDENNNNKNNHNSNLSDSTNGQPVGVQHD